MSHREVLFPVNISRAAVGGPEFSTYVVEAASGEEQRNINMTNPRRRYGINTKDMQEADFAPLRDFIIAIGFGRGHSFNFKDWSDFSVADQTLGTGDGAEVDFQIVVNVISGGFQYTRTILKPVASTVVVKLDGTPTVLFSLDATTGVVTMDSAPGGGVVVTATFEWYVPVRFDGDYQPISLEPGIFGAYDSISFREVLKA